MIVPLPDGTTIEVEVKGVTTTQRLWEIINDKLREVNSPYRMFAPYVEWKKLKINKRNGK